MKEDDGPKKVAARTTVENIRSRIGIAVSLVAAVEFWGGIVLGVLFAIALTVAAIIAAIPVIKSWFG